MHVGRVDRPLAFSHFGRVEGDLVEQPLHDRVETAGADVLGALVDLRGDVGDLGDRIVA